MLQGISRAKYHIVAGATGAVMFLWIYEAVERWRKEIPYASRIRAKSQSGSSSGLEKCLKYIKRLGGEMLFFRGLERKEEILDRRRRYMSKSQSISYENVNPLLLVKGKGCFMYNEKKEKFLDTRNNVAHVGHSSREVARAVSDQIYTLNTNTRYLHPNVTTLAQRIIETMPKESELYKNGTVFFVNSGSEANDLALRICRAYTCRRGILVLDGAYHGHTSSTIEISPYKYNHPSNFSIKPDHVQAVKSPDTYRGRASAKALVADIEKNVQILDEEKGYGIAALFVESFMSVAGVLVPPPTYFQYAFDIIRKHGGLCVCDEIQTGLGRTADEELPKIWYAFERHHVFPDIVTIGKPLGNGMPIACLVTTRKIADAFATGPEYFNTFGGNPVSCAAALAVLDLVEFSGLRENAIRVGAYLKQRLLNELSGQSVADHADESFKHLVVSNLRKDRQNRRNSSTTLTAQSERSRQSSSGQSLSGSATKKIKKQNSLPGYSSADESDHPQHQAETPKKSHSAAITDTPPQLRRPRSVVTIGDVRGAGLYLGVEFVTNFASREPATAAANFLCSALVHKHHILTTLDGPYQNVLVIKPPLSFSKQNADLLVNALKTEMQYLDTLPPEYLAGVTPTPT